MKGLVVVLLLLHISTTKTNGQSYVVENVEIKVGGSNPHTVVLPKLIPSDYLDPHIAELINSSILNHFDLEEYQIDADEQYAWFTDTFIFEINEHYVYFSFEAAFVSNRAYDHEWNVYYDLTTGLEYTGENVDFHFLFDPEKYLPFIDTYWKPEVTKMLKAAEDCKGLHYVDERFAVSTYRIDEDSITLNSMSYRDFPTMYWECAPYVEVKVSLDELQNYLTNEGIAYVSEVSHARKSKLVLVDAIQKFRKVSESGMYLFGKVDSLYPVSIYIELDKQTMELGGWYYYDKYKVKIELKGTMDVNIMTLNEQTEDGSGGQISIKSNPSYSEGFFQYEYGLKGTWQDQEKGVSYEILFIDLLPWSNTVY